MDAGGQDGNRKSQKLEPQINDKETSDVVILLVESGEELNLYAHKAVLTRHSDYFRSDFSERWSQGKEKSMTTIDTSGKGGIAKYEKFFQFIYKEPITVGSLDLHGILDILEIASELLCRDIVNACDRVYWPEGDVIGARLMGLCDKFKCSQELAERLVEYGHTGHLSALKQKAVDVWQKKAGSSCQRYITEEFGSFTLMILPIVPEKFVAHTVLPALLPGYIACSWSCYEKMLLIILERWLSNKESDASNHLDIAKGLVHSLRTANRKFEVVEDKLNQLVSKLGEVEQWEVFVVRAEKGKLGWPDLKRSWFNFCQHFCHLPAVQDAVVKSWRETKDKHFAYLTELLMEMMPEEVVRNFALVSENFQLSKRLLKKKEADMIFTLCSDVCEQVTAGKLVLDASERSALGKHVMALMYTATNAPGCSNHYRKYSSAITATESLIKLVKTIPAEKRCDLLLGRVADWPSLGEAFGPLQNLS